MGHEKASTTLDLYTHHSNHGDQAVRNAFADDLLTTALDSAANTPESDQEDTEPEGEEETS